MNELRISKIGTVTRGPRLRNGIANIEMDGDTDILASHALAMYVAQFATVGKAIYVRGYMSDHGPLTYVRAKEIVL
jgi:hypothetical protein